MSVMTAIANTLLLLTSLTLPFTLTCPSSVPGTIFVLSRYIYSGPPLFLFCKILKVTTQIQKTPDISLKLYRLHTQLLQMIHKLTLSSICLKLNIPPLVVPHCLQNPSPLLDIASPYHFSLILCHSYSFSE